MNTLIKKLANHYDLSHIKYKYQIGFYADLFAVVVMNLVGLIWLSAPVSAIIAIVVNTPIDDYSMITVDNFMGLCIFNFFYFGLSYIFFMHNKNNLASKLLFFGYSWMGIAVLTLLINISYHFVRININLAMQPNENLWVLYLDLSILAVVGFVSLCFNQKVHNFFDRNLTKYQG